MNYKYILLILGLSLIGFGLIKPNLGSYVPSTTVSIVDVSKPSDPSLLSLADNLVKAVRSNNVSREDGLRLASLCVDMSTLISLDGASEIIKTTEEIRQANRLSGLMLRMDMNKKYPDLATQMNALVVGYIGDDIVNLNSELRSKSSDAFRALAWSLVEGSK